VSKTIRPPSLVTFALTLAGALAGTYAAMQLFAPYAEESQAMAELFVAMPVATAVLGYMLYPSAQRA
jgi:hypothetical protein